MRQIKTSKERYERNIYLLGITSLFTDISTEMLSPILPLFLANVLGASGAVIGGIEGIANASERVLSLLFGWLSDRMGKRKPIIFVGYFLSAIMKGVFALTTSWPQFFVARIVERTGKAIRTPARDALIAQSIFLDKRAKMTRMSGYAIHRMLDTLGAIIGPIVSIVLIATILSGMEFGEIARTIFLYSLIPGFAGILFLFLVKEPKIKKRTADFKFSIKGFGKRYKTFLISVALLYLAWPTQAFLYLKSSEVGFEIGNILILATIFSITYILGASLCGIVKIAEKMILQFGIFIFSVTLFLVAFSDIHSFLAVFLAYGFIVGVLEVSMRAYISRIVESKKLGSAFGMYRTVTGLSMIISGIAIGLLWDISSFYAFSFASLLSFVSFLILVLSR